MLGLNGLNGLNMINKYFIRLVNDFYFKLIGLFDTRYLTDFNKVVNLTFILIVSLISELMRNFNVKLNLL